MVKYFQAIWAMEDTGFDTDEKINWIISNGYEGALNFIDDSSENALENSRSIDQLILEKGLILGLSCNGFDLDDIQNKIEYCKKSGADFINIMVKNYFATFEEACEMIQSGLELGRKLGVKVFIETHRATVTQDLKRTLCLSKKFPNMDMTIDLSHYIVAGEFTEENLLLYKEPLNSAFDDLLPHTGSLHLRLSNGEQVQVSLNRISDFHKKHFIRWWKKGIDFAIKKLNQGTNLSYVPVITELGPKDYQIAVLNEGQWLNDGDRLQESLDLVGILKEALKNQ